MLRLLLIVDLFRWLPWWGAVGTLVFLGIGLWGLGHYVIARLQRDVNSAVIAQGTPLTDAFVDVHFVEPTEPPNEPSLIGLDPEDENYDPELDGHETAPAADYFWVEATIAPRDPEATWNPSVLFLVEHDFEPEEELALCETMALVHTVEVWRHGSFIPQREGDVTGRQRLRMLLAVPHGLREAKFAYHFTCFGRLSLPAGVALVHS